MCVNNVLGNNVPRKCHVYQMIKNKKIIIANHFSRE